MSKIVDWLHHSHNGSLTLIIKITGRCSLNCKYCYSKQINKSLDIKELESIITNIGKVKEHKINFIWHGGEPLLVNEGVYRKIMKLQERWLEGKIISNSIQTSGSIEKPEGIIKQLTSMGYKIGVSFDGCETIQNRYRTESFNNTTKFMVLLKKYQGSLNILQVIVPESRNWVERMAENYTKLQVDSVTFLPFYNFQDKKLASLTNEEYYSFLEASYNKWVEQKNPMYTITNFVQFFQAKLGLTPSLCNYSGMCGTFLTIDSYGDTYTCSRLASEEHYKIGNVIEEGLDKILDSKKYISLLEEINSKKNEKCVLCKWFKFCNGGCMAQYTKEGFYYCETRKKLFNFFLGQSKKKEINYENY